MKAVVMEIRGKWAAVLCENGESKSDGIHCESYDTKQETNDEDSRCILLEYSSLMPSKHCCISNDSP